MVTEVTELTHITNKREKAALACGPRGSRASDADGPARGRHTAWRGLAPNRQAIFTCCTF